MKRCEDIHLAVVIGTPDVEPRPSPLTAQPRNQTSLGLLVPDVNRPNLDGPAYDLNEPRRRVHAEPHQVRVKDAVPKEPVVRLPRLVQALAAQAEVKLVRLGRKIKRAEVEDLLHVGQPVLVARLAPERHNLDAGYAEDLGVLDLADRGAPDDEDQVVKHTV